jgi:hypothetical protein
MLLTFGQCQFRSFNRLFCIFLTDHFGEQEIGQLFDVIAVVDAIMP